MSFIIDNTGWLTDWEKSGGRFKEWIRSISLSSINHGWLYAIWIQPACIWSKVWNALTWLPFLYDDFDWDHTYLWKVMRYKIERMRKCQEQGRHLDWKKVADEMHVAELILSRLIDDTYVRDEWEEHFKKYGSIWDRRVKQPDGSAISYPHPDPECSKDVRRLSKLEDQRRRFDMDYLGQYLAKHQRMWWC
jgi:hypothetical protein